MYENDKGENETISSKYMDIILFQIVWNGMKEGIIIINISINLSQKTIQISFYSPLVPLHPSEALLI